MSNFARIPAHQRRTPGLRRRSQSAHASRHLRSSADQNLRCCATRPSPVSCMTSRSIRTSGPCVRPFSTDSKASAPTGIARELGYYSDEADDFYILALEALTDDRLSVEGTDPPFTMRTGEMAIEVMKKLDEANTAIYQNPAPQKSMSTRKRSVYHRLRTRFKRP